MVSKIMKIGMDYSLPSVISVISLSVSLFVLFLSPFSGTGSYPPLENGLQRKILLIVRINPTKKPRFLNASMA